jgi:hypothetical protein
MCAYSETKRVDQKKSITPREARTRFYMLCEEMGESTCLRRKAEGRQTVSLPVTSKVTNRHASGLPLLFECALGGVLYE